MLVDHSSAAARWAAGVRRLTWGGLLLVAAGCQSNTQLASLQSQNRVLAEQNRAQLAEIQNLKIHNRHVEDQLIRAEQQLAELERNGRRLAGTTMPAGMTGRLAALAARYPSLQFDPQTGISKIDTDVLFDSGNDQLKPEAEQLLREIAEIFNAPEARELKLMVVGHADSQAIRGEELKSRYPTNWHLSAGRALAVADWLRGSGIPENRMGVAGFGQFQPIASNDREDTRSRNRRVEIYVLGPETPMVGWAETSGRFYR
jgi:chemotaxis protein MotB